MKEKKKNKNKKNGYGYGYQSIVYNYIQHQQRQNKVSKKNKRRGSVESTQPRHDKTDKKSQPAKTSRFDPSAKKNHKVRKWKISKAACASKEHQSLSFLHAPVLRIHRTGPKMHTMCSSSILDLKHPIIKEMFQSSIDTATGIRPAAPANSIGSLWS